MKKWVGVIILILGLSIITFPIFKSKPTIKYEDFPNKSFAPQMKQLNITPQKDWIDYVDKIVGWVVSLSGVYILIRRKPA
jgi:hypothetical protein